MTCRELTDFMADYLSGTLPHETRTLFEAHLALCGNCAQYLAGYRAAVALGREAFDDLDSDVPASVPEELVEAILAARR